MPTDDTRPDPLRLQAIRDAADAARPGDLQALWSFEADFRWLLSLALAASPATDRERLWEGLRRENEQLRTLYRECTERRLAAEPRAGEGQGEPDTTERTE